MQGFNFIIFSSNNPYQLSKSSNCTWPKKWSLVSFYSSHSAKKVKQKARQMSAFLYKFPCLDDLQ